MVFNLLARYRLLAGYIYLCLIVIFMNPTLLSCLLGGAVMMAGEFLRTWASGYIYKDEELAQEGPYSLVRNPLYLGSFFIGLGAAILSARLLFLILYPFLFLATYLPLIQKEEARLLERFGEQALRYMQRVPRLLPSFETFVPPHTPWNLERTIFLHREWINWVLISLLVALGVWRLPA